MTTAKFTISVQVDLESAPGTYRILGDPMLKLIELNVEGCIEGTLRGNHIATEEIRAVVRRAEEI